MLTKLKINRSQVMYQVMYQVMDQVKDQVKDRVLHQVRTHVFNQGRVQMITQLEQVQADFV
jgi:hypothetical protein